MNFFQKSIINNVHVLALAGGTPVTALTDVDFTVYETKNGGVPAAVNVIGLVTELDAVNMAGWYVVAMPAASFDTDGIIGFNFTMTGADVYNTLGDVGFYDSMLDVKAVVGQVNFRITGTAYDGDGNMTAATMKGYNNAADAIADTAERIELTLSEATYNLDGTMLEMVVTEV